MSFCGTFVTILLTFPKFAINLAPEPTIPPFDFAFVLFQIHQTNPNAFQNSEISRSLPLIQPAPPLLFKLFQLFLIFLV